MQLIVFGSRFTTLLAMKLLILLTIVACLQASAKGFGQTVTLTLNNASLERAFKEIKKQTGYSFVYTRAQLKNSFPVSCQVKNAEIKETLDLCFRNQPLSFVIEGHYIVVQTKPTGIQSSTTQFLPIDISGRVINENGEPMEGASVLIKGTQKGTTTNIDGYFKLKNIDENAILIITGVSIQTMEIKVAGKSDIIINVKTKITAEDEVIINAGYYKTTDRLKTGNISRVDAETIEKQPVSNPLAALEGRVPGLYIQQNTGVTGGSFTIQIRGQNSIANGNDPLYIIDGVPFTSVSLSNYGVSGNITGGGSPLNSLNPANIESIEILKDADATAIYGSRGANGVVLITTKKGKSGKIATSINVYSGFGKITRKMNLLNTRQYLDMRHEAFLNDMAIPQPSDYDVNGTWDTTRFTDWQKVLIGGTALITDIQGSISGGNDNTQFLIGGGYHYESSVFPGGSGNRRPSALLNLTHLSPDQKFKSNFLASYSIDNNKLINYDHTSIALTLPPSGPPLWDSSGNLNWENGTFRNPFASLLRPYEANTHTILSNAFLSYDVMKDLELKLSLGYSNMEIKEKSLYPLTSINPASGYTSGFSIFSNSALQTWIVEPQMHYKRSLKNGHLDILLGTTFQQSKGDLETLYANGFVNDALLNNLAAASSIFVLGADDYQYRYSAIFGRFGYNWKDKYLLNVTGRRDGSSRFGPGRQFANFGAIGGGWIFSKEKGIQNALPFLSFGKIHLSFGTTGSDQIGNYRYLDTYGPTTWPYQGNSGLYPLRLFNPDYGWETNKKLEAGLDIGLLSDHILFGADWYRNRSSNQLIGYSLAPTSGFLFITNNLAAIVQNTGLEFELKTINIKSKNFSWISSFNISFPRNKLIAFPNLLTSVYGQIYEIGKPLSIIKAFESNGVNLQNGVYQFKDRKDSSTMQPLYPDDLRGLKSISQDFYGGLQNTFRFRNWQLDFFLHFVKQTGRNYLYGGLFNAPGMIGNQPEFVLNRWQKQGNISGIQKFTQSYNSEAYNGYSNAVYSGDNTIGDASFIRLKNISLSYSISDKWLNKMNLQKARIYIQGQNLITITDYLGLDPENNTSPGALPPLKYITGGIQLTF